MTGLLIAIDLDDTPPPRALLDRPPFTEGPELDFGVASTGEQITILRRKLVIFRQIIDELQSRQARSA
jgi:hypothetical protein